MIYSKIKQRTILSFAFTLALGACVFTSACSKGKNGDEGASSESSAKADSEMVRIDHERENQGKYAIEGGKIVSASGRPMVVDFYADWCPPCKQMAPIFSSFAAKYKGSIDFVSVNIDEKRDLAVDYGVTSIPTFIFVSQDGKVVNKIVGALPENDFATALATCFPEEAVK